MESKLSKSDPPILGDGLTPLIKQLEQAITGILHRNHGEPALRAAWAMRAAITQLSALERVQETLTDERDEAMRVLAPNMPESGLVDACKQVKQAAISEADNAQKLEAELTAFQRVQETHQQALKAALTALLTREWTGDHQVWSPTCLWCGGYKRHPAMDQDYDGIAGHKANCPRQHAIAALTAALRVQEEPPATPSAPCDRSHEQAREIIQRMASLGDRLLYDDGFAGASACGLCHASLGADGRDDPDRHESDCVYIAARRLVAIAGW